MDHRDAAVSDVTVVLDAAHGAHINEAVAALKLVGLEVDDVNRDEGVVEGVIEAGQIPQLKKLPWVEYVRVEFTYIADFPPGDPRDRDTATSA